MTNVESKRVKYISQLFRVSEILILLLNGSNHLRDLTGNQSFNFIRTSLSLPISKSIIFKGRILDQLRSEDKLLPSLLGYLTWQEFIESLDEVDRRLLVEC